MVIKQIAGNSELDYVLKISKMLDEEMLPLFPDYLKSVSANADYNASDTYWQNILAGKKCFALLAWINGIPVGMAIVKEGVVCHLESLFVLSEYRNQGIGKTLVEYAKEISAKRGNKIMTLNVMLKNKNAKQMYESLGFMDFRITMATELNDFTNKK
jgi:ribosomal protein S18 acetylase RimI-like enzyme